MTNIENSKAAGEEKFSGRFLKDGANILVARLISTLRSLSVSPGLFTNAFKIAKLKPIFKNRKQTDLSNYGSISLLP